MDDLNNSSMIISLVNKRYLNFFTWGMDSFLTWVDYPPISCWEPWPPHPDPNPHPSRFTVGSKPVQWVLNVTDQWSQQHHFLCIKQRCNPQLPELQPLLDIWLCLEILSMKIINRIVRWHGAARTEASHHWHWHWMAHGLDAIGEVTSSPHTPAAPHTKPPREPGHVFSRFTKNM